MHPQSTLVEELQMTSPETSLLSILQLLKKFSFGKEDQWRKVMQVVLLLTVDMFMLFDFCAHGECGDAG